MVIIVNQNMNMPLEAEGWKYSSGNNIRRVTKRDVLIVDDFKKFMVDTNPDLTEEEVTQIFDNVRLVGAESDFATLHKVYGWMVNGVQFTPQNELPGMIPLIDFENWDLPCSEPVYSRIYKQWSKRKS